MGVGMAAPRGHTPLDLPAFKSRMGCADCELAFCSACAWAHECFLEDSLPHAVHNNSYLAGAQVVPILQ